MTASEPPGVALHLNRVDGDGEPDAEDELLRRAARAALEASDRPLSGEVSVTLLDRERIAGLNRDYLGREGPTDVIAFDLGEDELLGDVYVCPQVARASARSAGVEPREELVRLVIHGVLHVLGYDHPEDEGRWDSEMFRLQERLVRRTLDPGAG